MNDDFKKLLKAASFGLKAFSMGLHEVAKNIDALADTPSPSESDDKSQASSPPPPKPETAE